MVELSRFMPEVKQRRFDETTLGVLFSGALSMLRAQEFVQLAGVDPWSPVDNSG
jgi:hypothetical protein